ncbi:hypothetical protein CDD80_4337 [Ophiocordyceps camponoti-rufipedis]|uniref:Tyrosinase copper-binding domain-containing protein n=1 Tax=Ophiocordyceps camponoti-rufipedis TaxID=2004952 RepID=A0A2C5ZMG7_9HYPO|nr:hypothetical protein CDD80_4337 [Ophiocordyceps camponoti-rufipedis]
MASIASVLLLALAAALQGLAQNFVPVTGVPVNQQATPMRRNINDLQAEGGPQWSLYNLALLEMQRDPDDYQLSYFQLMGIHGLPFIEWNGAGPGVGEAWGGYCPHNENLFLSWHRAYIVLFEQTLVQKARQIASAYPQEIRDQWLQAAETLRSPYWDWASDSNVPPATTWATVRVTGNQGLPIDIPNPLMPYRFPQDALNGKYGPFDAQMRAETYRCSAPSSYPQSANGLLGSRPLRQWTYDILTRAANYSEFSLGGGLVSVEQIHNQIHLDAACGNIFSEFALTAFDPLFVLHHTQVDRLWSFWQVLRPDQDIFSQPYAGLSRFATRQGTIITWDSPLEPFFDRRRAFLTTSAVRAIWNFGYSYAGIEWWQKNEQQMRQDVTTLINQLYGSNRPGFVQKRGEPATRYFAKMSVDVAQLERPCRVSLFVNGTRAGSLAVMGRPEKGIVNTGFGLDVVAPAEELASILEERAGGRKPTVEVEIRKLDGTIIPLKGVTSLQVEMEAVQVVHPSKLEELPQYGQSRQFGAAVVERHQS